MSDYEEQEEISPKVEREQQMLEERKGLGDVSTRVIDDFGFMMSRLHDPTNYDHTTLEDMLDSYHFRDLAKSKLFRIAKKIFGDKMDPKFRIRTRTFNLVGVKQGQPRIAETTSREEYRPLEVAESDDEDLVDINDIALRRNNNTAPALSNTQNNKSNDKYSDYQQWFKDRKKLRHELNSLGLTESWLSNKPDKTEMEHILYQEMIERRESLEDLDDEHEDDHTDDSKTRIMKSEGLPRIRRPSPIALRKLDRFLRANRLRLIDIFTMIDKNKTWNISREQFMSAVEEYGMDISPAILEDLMTTLDTNRNGELNYKELVKGLELYNMEKKETKVQGVPMPQDSNEEIEEPMAASSPLGKSPTASRTSSSTRRQASKSAQSSRGSRASSATTLLDAPELDLQESRLVLESQEEQVDIRKRDKNFLKYIKGGSTSRKSAGIITPSLSRHNNKLSALKTGYRPIDNHCKFSMLEGETGSMIDDFRQLKLKEYYKIVKLCDERDIVLSRQLLDRVLLHPGDKSVKLMIKQGIRQPGSSVPLSRHFADPPKRPRTPIEVRNRGKMKRGEDGQLLIDYKHRFPPKAKTISVPSKVQLATGKVAVSRKVDCWLTFEEYEKMTRKFYKERYVKMASEGDTTATWPGYMLDKMRVYIDNARTGKPSNSVFHHVKKEPLHYHGYDNDLNIWNISDSGYLCQGQLMHPKKSYAANNLAPTVQPTVSYKNHQIHKPTLGLTMHTKNTQGTFHS